MKNLGKNVFRSALVWLFISAVYLLCYGLYQGFLDLYASGWPVVAILLFLGSLISLVVVFFYLVVLPCFVLEDEA